LRASIPLGHLAEDVTQEAGCAPYDHGRTAAFQTQERELELRQLALRLRPLRDSRPE